VQSYFLEKIQRLEELSIAIHKELHGMTLKITSVFVQVMRIKLTKYGDLDLFQVQDMHHIQQILHLYLQLSNCKL